MPPGSWTLSLVSIFCPIQSCLSGEGPNKQLITFLGLVIPPSCFMEKHAVPAEPGAERKQDHDLVVRGITLPCAGCWGLFAYTRWMRIRHLTTTYERELWHRLIPPELQVGGTGCKQGKNVQGILVCCCSGLGWASQIPHPLEVPGECVMVCL